MMEHLKVQKSNQDGSYECRFQIKFDKHKIFRIVRNELNNSPGLSCLLSSQ